MAVPFNVGDPAAKIELDGSAVRVYSTKVVEVGDDYAVDEQGHRHEFDRAGESPELVPLDNELAVELMVRGEGFVVEEERLREPWQQRDPFGPELPDIGGEGIGS